MCIEGGYIQKAYDMVSWKFVVADCPRNMGLNNLVEERIINCVILFIEYKLMRASQILLHPFGAIVRGPSLAVPCLYLFCGEVLL